MYHGNNHHRRKRHECGCNANLCVVYRYHEKTESRKRADEGGENCEFHCVGILKCVDYILRYFPEKKGNPDYSSCYDNPHEGCRYGLHGITYLKHAVLGYHHADTRGLPLRWSQEAHLLSCFSFPPLLLSRLWQSTYIRTRNASKREKKAMASILK